MKTHRVSTKDWRKAYYTSLRGIPTIDDINEEIKNGNIPGKVIAGKGVVYCDHQFEPLWNHEDTIKPLSTGNKMADAILKRNHLTTQQVANA